MADVVRRCIVQGKVQGVFFRASTRKVALELGLLGWAKNCPDGSVEVLARGSENAVSQLSAWLWQGPEHARVDEVRCEELASFVESIDGFQIL